MGVKVDDTGKSIRELEDGLVKIDGVTVFRKVIRDGITYLQFCDHDRMRSNCRGTRYIEVPINILMEKLA